MPTKTATKQKATASAKPRATKAQPKATAKAAPKLTRAEAQDKAVAAIEASLDTDSTSVGEAAILELRNEFDKLKHHTPFRELFARARYSPEPK